MSDKIEEIRARHELVGGSGSVIHPTGWCWSIPGWVAHADRATLLAEVARLRVEIERLRTVYVLIVSEEAGPIDSATCWYEDKIIGCYISREAAEGAAKLLMADWRISEYALEGKP